MNSIELLPWLPFFLGEDFMNYHNVRLSCVSLLLIYLLILSLFLVRLYQKLFLLPDLVPPALLVGYCCLVISLLDVQLALCKCLPWFLFVDWTVIIGWVIIGPVQSTCSRGAPGYCYLVVNSFGLCCCSFCFWRQLDGIYLCCIHVVADDSCGFYLELAPESCWLIDSLLLGCWIVQVFYNMGFGEGQLICFFLTLDFLIFLFQIVMFVLICICSK